MVPFTEQELILKFSLDLDKYGSKNTGSHTNIQENIGGAYKQIRTDGVYIRSHGWSIYTRRKIYEKVKI